jgi:hypothetical protein
MHDHQNGANFGVNVHWLPAPLPSTGTQTGGDPCFAATWFQKSETAHPAVYAPKPVVSRLCLSRPCWCVEGTNHPRDWPSPCETDPQPRFVISIAMKTRALTSIVSIQRLHVIIVLCCTVAGLVMIKSACIPLGKVKHQGAMPPSCRHISSSTADWPNHAPVWLQANKGELFPSSWDGNVSSGGPVPSELSGSQQGEDAYAYNNFFRNTLSGSYLEVGFLPRQ